MQGVRRATDFDLASLSEVDRQELVCRVTAPRPLRIENSALKFHVHSVTEDARIRKFKEPWTIEWLRSLRPDAVLYDVGANIGITALVAAESAGPGVKVVAIEPFPANFASLVKNIQANGLNARVIPLAVGLGADTAIIPLHWVSDDPGGSLHSFGDIVVLSPNERIAPVSFHMCMSYRLDDLICMPGLPFPTHIKIDVDGGETAVLMGAAGVLADPRCRAVQVEVVDQGPERACTCEIVAHLDRAGMNLVAAHAHGETYPRVFDLQFERVSGDRALG